MADACPRLGAGERGRTGIAEEIEDADGTVRAADLLHRPVPVAGLLGEDAGVLEVHGADIEGQLAVVDLPAFGQGGLVPAAAAGLAALIAAVTHVPVRVAARRFPDGLGIGAHKVVFAPALELFALGAVNQLKIFPLVRDIHKRSSVCKAYYSNIIHDILPLMPSSVKGEEGRRKVWARYLRRLLFRAVSTRMKKEKRRDRICVRSI